MNLNGAYSGVNGLQNLQMVVQLGQEVLPKFQETTGYQFNNI